MRTIMAVTVGPSDWGIFRPVLQHIRNDPELELRLVAGGAHLSDAEGDTLGAIRRDGFEIDDTVDMLLKTDSSLSTTKGMGLGMIGFAEVFERQRPDILLVLGDRFEMTVAALAAVPFGIPIAFADTHKHEHMQLKELLSTYFRSAKLHDCQEFNGEI